MMTITFKNGKQVKISDENVHHINVIMAEGKQSVNHFATFKNENGKIYLVVNVCEISSITQ